MLFRFEDFELDTDRFELRRAGEGLHVEPKVFRLIAHLVGNADRVIDTDELMEAVWAGRIVSDATIAGCIKHARKALDDSGETQRLIRTVRGRGFRFVGESQGEEPLSSPASPVAPIDAQTIPAALNPPVTATLGTAPSIHQTVEPAIDPSILILPFVVRSDDARCHHLAMELPGCLGRILSRVPLLRISAQSFGPHDSPSFPSAQVAHAALGIDYVLDGSAQHANNSLVLDIRLVDARSGFVLWSENLTFDTSSCDDPSRPAGLSRDTLRDEVVVAIIKRVEPRLARAIYDSICARQSTPCARRLYLEANGMLSSRGWHYKSFPHARDLLRRSRELEPEFAHASGYLSFVLGFGHCMGILDDRERVYDEALEAAESALMHDSQESTVLSLAGCALADLGHPARALPILQHAVELNAANAQAWTALGSVCLTQRRLDEAITHLAHGVHISPLDTRLTVWGSVLSTALRLRGRYQEARVEAELACRREYTAYWPRVALAAVLLRQEDTTGARNALMDAYRAKPDLTPQQLRYLTGRRLTTELLALLA